MKNCAPQLHAWCILSPTQLFMFGHAELKHWVGVKEHGNKLLGLMISTLLKQHFVVGKQKCGFVISNLPNSDTKVCVYKKLGIFFSKFAKIVELTPVSLLIEYIPRGIDTL